jgi:hypothetical protein
MKTDTKYFKALYDFCVNSEKLTQKDICEFCKNYKSQNLVNVSQKESLAFAKTVMQKRAERKQIKDAEFETLRDRYNLSKVSILSELFLEKFKFLAITKNRTVFTASDEEFELLKRYKTAKSGKYLNSQSIYSVNFCLSDIDSVPRKFLVIDGIINKKIYSKTVKQGITLIDAEVFVQDGRDIEAKRVKIAVRGNFAYHSEISWGDAIEGLYKKIDKSVKKYFRLNNVTLDTKMTRRLYSEITGACSFGVNEFCKKYGLENTKEIAVRDLLPILESENAYGLQILKKALI